MPSPHAGGEAVAPLDRTHRNPETTADRRLSKHPSAWVRSFSCEDVRPLIVCRGPIRKEAMDVFTEMGIEHFGMLLSEKDSIVYTHALAPELRGVRPEQVHRVRDYSGATREERVERMHEIVGICRSHGYTHVFAGYGFMAEDEEFVRTLEEAGIGFIGPCSRVQAVAGKKDEAKRTALRERVSVTPGIDDTTTRLILRKYPDPAALRAVARERGLQVPAEVSADGADSRAAAEALLRASYAARTDLYTIDDLGEELARGVAELLAAHPGRRVRLKAIAGGGGKGQRILAGIPAGLVGEEAARAAAEAARKAPEAAREILAEVKATGVGDDKNILIELNVEQTRHNEIQLLGNGAWCISLGGRDCSVQMHEQKLLEVSITQEGLRQGIERARSEGRWAAAAVLEADLATLVRMEAEAERFGLAVGLDSASTFECIVEGTRHYFMEVNTRIQVEHRVSELCYRLRFENPERPGDAFEVSSIVEAMVLLARHGARLPRPTRVPRHAAAVEARLNATDRALQPHAGGIIQSWTDPVEHEIRDDQGICRRNPDTGAFVHYRLAGAYDSNIALLVTYGDERRQSFERLAEILRRMKLRGVDLQTNNAFLYGLVHWLLGQDVWAKPTTGFVVPYLTQVGLLAEALREIDRETLWTELCRRVEARVLAASGAGDPEARAAVSAAARKLLSRKQTLLERPLDVLFGEPHVLSAWLSRQRGRIQLPGPEGPAGRVRWRDNPLEVLADTYALLNLDYREDAPAAHVIWDHDHALLQAGRGFYARLRERTGVATWAETEALLARDEPPRGFDAATWHAVRCAHLGHQAGLELLDVLIHLGARTGFFDLRVEDDLSISIPERLRDPALWARVKKALVPPPAARAGEIVAPYGGMFYAQEAPHLPPFVRVGDHFEAGQPLYIIEVMKMFNKVLAPFAGTVDEILVQGGDGTVVQKGQPLFRVTPDETVVEEDAATRAARRRAATIAWIEAALPVAASTAGSATGGRAIAGTSAGPAAPT
jgi:acetyl/propionyl-CoA carboxylase alpha subunit